MAPFVHDFEHGNKDAKDLLGGKGANLAEMTNLGIPVPPGFTIDTDACRAYLAAGAMPESLAAEVDEHLATLEGKAGRRLGDADDPLLVSVRSGAKFSMPGMMETVLNVGLNDESVEGLATQTGNDRFAWDSYRRLLQMFGKTVLDLEGERFEDAMDAIKKAKGVTGDLDLDTDDLRDLVAAYKVIIREDSGAEFPQDPKAQLMGAVEAVFNSWNSDRAVLYRRRERIPSDLGTAVNVQAMVFGNRGMDSGSGVAFTRDPSTGAVGVYGDYLQNAQGEDVVAGIRNTLTLADMERIDTKSYDDLIAIMAQLEAHYRDMCDIEFTVENGKLFMLQTRVGKRTAGAAFRIAVDMLDAGLISEDEALQRVTGDQLAQLMFPHFAHDGAQALLTKGMSASPGAAVGKAYFTSEAAVAAAEDGTPVILVRRETNPDDLHGMVAAQGILTSRGGKTSHAAVVAVAWAAPACAAPSNSRSTSGGRSSRRPAASSSRRATPSRSMVRPVRSSSARCRSSPPLSSSTSRARSTPTPRTRTPSCVPCTASCRSPTGCAICASGPTPTRPRTPPAPAASARRASVCVGPSTCSSASVAPWSSG
jgi:pyruvate,orthophosphate dikinase